MALMLVRWCVAVACCVAVNGTVLSHAASAQSPSDLSTVLLPEIRIDGDAVKIHTQGLYVTGQDYIVTGRVDTPPKRPVVMRFSGEDPSDYELLDLGLLDRKDAGLNHPGGFDRDERGVFWIPLSTSHRQGPTLVVGIELRNGKLPADCSKITKSFQVSDHLGAICCLGKDRLLAANWDTKTVYLIDSSSATISEQVPQSEFFGNAKGVRLAVQDWKFDPLAKLVIAGGIDKSPERKPTESVAVVAWIDPILRKITRLIRLDPQADVARPLTNEGLALRNGRLFLLPEDFGRGAKILSFSPASN